MVDLASLALGALVGAAVTAVAGLYYFRRRDLLYISLLPERVKLCSRLGAAVRELRQPDGEKKLQAAFADAAGLLSEPSLRFFLSQRTPEKLADSGAELANVLRREVGLRPLSKNTLDLIKAAGK
jgi:hypothetical protein